MRNYVSPVKGSRDFDFNLNFEFYYLSFPSCYLSQFHYFHPSFSSGAFSSRTLLPLSSLHPSWVAMAIPASTTKLCFRFRHISSQPSVSLIYFPFILHFFLAFFLASIRLFLIRLIVQTRMLMRGCRLQEDGLFPFWIFRTFRNERPNTRLIVTKPHQSLVCWLQIDPSEFR